MRWFHALATGLAVASTLQLGACASNADSATTAATKPPLLVAQRGRMMPLELVVRKIAFRPYLPPGTIVAFAAIPPLDDSAKPLRNGMAVEYTARHRTMVLSEWMRGGYTLVFGSHNAGTTPCTVVRSGPNAVAWTTQRGLLLTLQPDGAGNARAIDTEAHRLIQAGACR